MTLPRRLFLLLLLLLLCWGWPVHAAPADAAPRRIAYGGDPRQFGELFVPPGAGPFPVAVLIHGGCWSAGVAGPDYLHPLAEDLRRNGVAVWNIEYRQLNDAGGGYPGTFIDTGSAVDYLRELAKTTPLDLKRIVLIGHSAGGHLALWAAARGHLPAGSALRQDNPLAVSGVVSLAGIGDLAAFRDYPSCGNPATIDRLVGDRKNPYADTSPIDLLPLNVPQIIVSGDRDTIVPRRFGDAYVAAAVKAGDPAQALDFPDADHMKLVDAASNNWARTKELIFILLK